MTEYLNPYHIALLSLPKIHTDLLWYLTFFFCGLGVLYFVFVFFFRNNLSKRASAIADRKRELAPMISQFLFLDEQATTEERIKYLSQKVEVRELIKTKFNRQVLSEILLDLQKDVAGEARENLYDLYKGLGLHYDAYAKLRSWRWEIVSQGILELTQMRVEESYMFIRRFINHRKGVVRKQAQIATVSLKNEGIGYFLDTCRYNISEWQQLKLLDVLRQLEDFSPPRFKIWLTSKNRDVVLFALRLIRYYNQNDANQAIIHLLKHRNSQIKSEAIQCLKEFGVTESIYTLKSTFRKCGIEEKIAILDAIATLGTEKEIEFLKKVEYTDENFMVRSKALSAINTIDPESIVPSEGIQEPTAADKRFAEEAVEEVPDMTEATSELEIEDILLEQDQFNEQVLVDEEIEQEIQATEEPREEEFTAEEKAESSNEDEDPMELPELLGEDEFIFDLCVMEELEDILDDVQREEEPEYLPLNFLPIVREESGENVSVLTDEDFSQDLTTIPEIDEQTFKKNLDAIIKNIAMKDKRNKPKIEEVIPDFLPRVVENEENIEEPDMGHTISEIEVISESVSNQKPLLQDSILEEEYRLHQESIKDTPVVSETIPWGELVPDNSSDKGSWQEETDLDEDLTEGLLGFSIFHEMFRDFDAESKLILLDEILVVGEEKELRFLGTLDNDPDKRIRKKAMKIKSQLAEKLKAKKQEEEVKMAHTVQATDDYAEDLAPEDMDDTLMEESTTVTKDEKLPLEYCLYEGAINELLESNDIDPYFDIDLNSIETEISEFEEDSTDNLSDSTEKKKSIIDNLFSDNLFSAKKKDSENG